MTKKFKNGLAVLLAVMVAFLSVGPTASAAAGTNKEIEEVDQLATDLEFLMEEAAIFDENNNVIGFHFDKLEDKFGDVEEFKMLEEQVDSSIQPMAKKTWKGCMIDSLKDHFGVAIIEVALTGGLWTYLEKKAYKEAAKLLIKIGIGGNVIGLAAFLTYYSAKCLDGTGPWASNITDSEDTFINKNQYSIV
jgi:hypothetical protein